MQLKLSMASATVKRPGASADGGAASKRPRDE